MLMKMLGKDLNCYLHMVRPSLHTHFANIVTSLSSVHTSCNKIAGSNDLLVVMLVQRLKGYTKTVPLLEYSL